MKQKSMYFILLCMFALIFTAGAQTMLYVDGSVPLSGTGALGSPYKTIGEALVDASTDSLLFDHVTILIKPGVYNEQLSIAGKPTDNTLKITAFDPLDMPVLDGNNQLIHGIRIDKKDTEYFNIEISNLIIRNYRTFGIYTNNMNDSTIKNNILYNNGNRPDAADDEGHGIITYSGYNLDIHNNLTYNNGPELIDGHLGNGIEVFGLVDSTVRDNVAFDNEGNGYLVECSYFVDFEGNSSNYDYTRIPFKCGGLWLDDGLGTTVKDSLFVNDYLGIYITNEDHNWANSYVIDDNIIKDNDYGTLATSFNPDAPTLEALGEKYDIDFKDNNRHIDLNRIEDVVVSTINNHNYEAKTIHIATSADTVFINRAGQSIGNPISVSSDSANPHHGYTDIARSGDKYRFIIFNNDQTTDFTRYLRITDSITGNNATLGAVIDGRLMSNKVALSTNGTTPVSRTMQNDGAGKLFTYTFNEDVVMTELNHSPDYPDLLNATYTIKKNTQILIKIITMPTPTPAMSPTPTPTPDALTNLILNSRFVDGTSDWTFFKSSYAPVPDAYFAAGKPAGYVVITDGGDSPTDLIVYQDTIPVSYDTDYYLSFYAGLYNAAPGTTRTIDVAFRGNDYPNPILESHTITLKNDLQRFEFALNNRTVGLDTIMLAFHVGGNNNSVKINNVIFKETAKTYFVGKKNANDAAGYGDDSLKPYASINYALQQALVTAATEPVTVKILAGEYDEVLTFNGVSSQYPITIMGEKGYEQNKLTMFNGTKDGVENDYAIDITNSKNIIINDIAFTNYKTAAINIRYSEDVTIDKIIAYDCGYASAHDDQNGYGIDARYSSNVTIKDSLLYNNGPATINVAQDIIGAGINTVSLRDSNILRNSTYNNKGAGILIKSGLTILLDGNTANNHDLGSVGPNLETLWKYSGIGIDGGDNIVVDYNMVNSNYFGIALSDVYAQLPGSYGVRFNKLLNNDTGIKIINLKDAGATSYDNLTLTENDFIGNTTDQNDSIIMMLDKTPMNADASNLLIDNAGVTASNGLGMKSESLEYAKVRGDISVGGDYIEIDHEYMNNFYITPTIKKEEGYTITIVKNGVVYQKAITPQSPEFDDITIAYAYNDQEELTFYEITFPASDLVLNEYDNPSATASITIEGGSSLTLGNTNKIGNYHFNGTNDYSGWATYVYSPTADATSDVINDEVVVDITNPGTEGWHVQIYAPNVSLTAGKKYTIAFEARTTAGANRTVDAYVCLSADPYTPYSQPFSPTLSDTTGHFSYSFVASSTVSGCQLEFDLGGQSDDVIIDNILLIEE